MLGHEKLIFCFSGTFMKKRMREGEKKIIVSDYFCFCFPVDSCETLCDFIYIAFNNKNIFENSKMKYSSNV